MSLPEPHIRRYLRWLNETRGLSFDADTPEGYDALWRWSVGDLRAFWGSIWDYFELQSPTPFEAVLADEVMPGARWFPGAQVNYARQVFRHVHRAEAANVPAIIAEDEHGNVAELTWSELRRRIASLA